MARPKKSYIWDHFTVSGLDESKATCVHCQQSVSRGGKTSKAYNTSNLRKHLNWKHQEQYTALQQAEKDQKLVEELSCKQPTIVEALENVKPYTFDHPRSRKDREHTWPILALMSTKYLCAPPSTVASERLFSTAGNILTETRNRLSADKLEKLLFFNKNLTLLNFEY